MRAAPTTLDGRIALHVATVRSACARACLARVGIKRQMFWRNTAHDRQNICISMHRPHPATRLALRAPEQAHMAAALHLVHD
ncbi:hypothetical protein DPV74_15275 [Burkholderia sp. HAN2018]|nr:hypothetical protein [Burkholderia sp. HAN2018]